MAKMLSESQAPAPHVFANRGGDQFFNQPPRRSPYISWRRDNSAGSYKSSSQSPSPVPGHRPLIDTVSTNNRNQRYLTPNMVRQGGPTRLSPGRHASLIPVNGYPSPNLPQRSKSLRVPNGTGSPRRVPGGRPSIAEPGQPLMSSNGYRHRTGSFPDSDSAQKPFEMDDPFYRSTSYKSPLRRNRSPRHGAAADAERLDVWPKAEHNLAAERFLQLPDAEDYTRLRTFSIDTKGCVVNRGDSFRLRSNTRGTNSSGGTPEYQPAETKKHPHANGVDARNHSIASADQEVVTYDIKTYHIVLIGVEGCGKTAVINQFLTSEHCNPFSNDLEHPKDNAVSVSIEGVVSELQFSEIDPEKDCAWQKEEADAYVIVYSCDWRSSFEEAAEVLRILRRRTDTTKSRVLMVANKVDLARKRAVTLIEGRSLSRTYKCDNYEISAAFNHGIDDLLIGILAEIKTLAANMTESVIANVASALVVEHPDFHRSILRFSQRKKRQTTPNSKKKTARATKSNESTTSCSNITSGIGGFVSRLLKRGNSKSCETLPYE